MFTTLRTYDNREIIIPNSKLTVSTLTNYTSMETRRVDLEYQVSYQADLAQVKAVLQKICDRHPLVLADPAPLIAVSAHKDSAIAIAVKAWCKTPDYWALFFDMQERVKLAFDAEGMPIPFPQMDVHLESHRGIRPQTAGKVQTYKNIQHNREEFYHEGLHPMSRQYCRKNGTNPKCTAGGRTLCGSFPYCKQSNGFCR